ncbi:MAG: tRNA pseudouridine(55) synthase TruB [Neisseriaceae bacterium]|nr:tRNA pseudouridine(55) synthase TruB [Neisseriaceae bacterium]
MTESNSKHSKRRVNGVLLFDKPLGISSNTALQQVKRLYHAQKAGHTGVLDPLATGLLPICFGEATKFAQYLLDADKAYTATVYLGKATSTGDAEGEVIEKSDVIPDENTFQAACDAFLGEIQQIPPMYSALKHQGRALYDYARQGIHIDRPPRDVVIHQIQIQSFRQPETVLDIKCSKGTYIRTLAEDIARHAGTVAHLTALRRTATAGFDIQNAYDWHTLENLNQEALDALLLPCDAGLRHLPEIILDNAQIQALQQGEKVAFHTNQSIISSFRVYNHEKRFIGLVQYISGSLKAQRLMSTEAERC